MQEELGLKHETEVLINELVKANSVPHVKKQLNISNDDVLIHVVRTRNVNQKVKILDEDYFLTSIVSDISNSVAKDSIYHYLETQLGLDISYSSKSITFEPFTEREYDVFGKIQPPYTATVRSVVYLNNTMPFQYNVSKI